MKPETKPSPTRAAVALGIALAYLIASTLYWTITFTVWAYAQHGTLGAMAAVLLCIIVARWYWRMWL